MSKTRFLYLTFVLCSLLPSYQSHAAKPNPNYPLEKAKIVQYTLYHVQKNYYDLNRTNIPELFEGALDGIQQEVPEVLAKCEKNIFCTVTALQATKRFSFPDNFDNLLLRLKEVFAFLAQHISQETDKRDVEFAAVRGLLDHLDPHSNFLPPEAFREFQVSTEGQFGGLGIVIGLRDGKLTVIAPLSGTPAHRAGIKAGDNILQIDDESTINMDLTEAVNRLRGPVGTGVRLKVERQGKERLTVQLKRAVISIEAVQSTLLTTNHQQKIGMIRVKNFQSNIDADFVEHYNNLQKQAQGKMRGLILDLRNNAGGLLDQAIQLSDLLLSKGMIVATVGPNRTLLAQSMAKPKAEEAKLPVVVLINQGSASAAEIVAGALKYNDRAILMGQQSFGKGSVQTVYQMPENAGLKLTIAEYWTTGNRSIQSVGITPDIELLPASIEKDNIDYLENKYRSEKDLEKHLEKTTAQAETPLLTLRYLAPTQKEEETEEYKEQIDISKDIAAQLALSFFTANPQAERTQWLVGLKDFLSEVQKKEEKKIAEQFETLHIPWKATPINGKPKAEIHFQLLAAGLPIAKARAGDKVHLKLTLANVGAGPFVRLIGSTDSENPLLKDLEFPFGTVEPNQKAVWEAPITIPGSVLDQEALVTVRFQEDSGQAAPTFELFVPIQSAPRPQLAYEYVLEGTTGKVVPRNKSVRLKVTVYNEGNTSTRETLVVLKNLGGKELFIEKGRIPLKAIAPKKKATADLAFHVDPTFKGENIPLEFSIVDTEILTGFSRKIDLQMEGAPNFLTPPEHKKYAPPIIQLSQIPAKTREAQIELTANIKDDEMVKDVFVFVGNKKVFYQTNPEKQKFFAFKSPIALEKGDNVVVVTARDNWNLQNSMTWSILYQ